MVAFRDLSGEKLGRLTPQWPVGIRGNLIHWLCLCECGNMFTTAGGSITRSKDNTISCGCFRQEVTGAIRRGKYKWPPKFDKAAWQRERRKSNRTTYDKYLKDSVARLRDACFKKLGDRCSSPDCAWINPDGTLGCTDRRCLQIDHVHGCGAEERKRENASGIYGKYRKIFADTTGKYQCLCANCNWIKITVNKEYGSYIKDKSMAPQPQPQPAPLPPS
jgi:hypothetical protein